MLSSIHPLGERARNNRWAVTVAAMGAGSAAAGAFAGGALGGLGGLAPQGTWRWMLAAAGMAAAGVADALGVRPPGPRRQVNEDWIGAYRGWVYGAAFGAQLGAGVATFVVTWGVWATALVAMLTGDPLAGASVGATFGVGRVAAPLAAGWIDRPSRLTAFSRRMASLATPVARTVAAGFVVCAAAIVLVHVTGSAA